MAGLLTGGFTFGGGKPRTTELPQARATGVSAFAFMLFLGNSLGALAVGALIARLGYAGAFLADAAAILVLGVTARWLLAA